MSILTKRQSAVKLLALVTAVAVSLVTLPMTVSAKTADELKNELSTLQQQKQAIDAQINTLGADISQEEQQYQEYLKALTNVRSQIAVYAEEVDGLNEKIEAKTLEIEAKNAEIAAKTTEIEQKQKDRDKTNEKFKSRLSAMYISSSDSSMLNVLFGAESFAEFLTESEMLKSISNNDQEMMEELMAQKVELETLKTDLQAKKDSLETAKQEIVTQQEQVVAVKSQAQVKEAEVDTLSQQSQALVENMSTKQGVLQTESEELLGDQNAISALIQAEEQRLAAEQAAAAAAAEAERIRLEKEAEDAANNGGGNNTTPPDGGSSGGSGSGGGGTTTPPPSIPESTGWLWPVPGYSYLSQGYGSGHTGLDIAAGTGTPIYASRGGYVVFAGFGDGSNGFNRYGNVLLINHNNGYYTLYAHCNELFVYQGQEVTQGQNIAAVGNTGQSFGAHLHFEIRAGFQSPRLNPTDFLNFE